MEAIPGQEFFRLRIDVLTLFPGIFSGPLDESILARARERSLVDVRVHDLRPFGIGRHHVCDDTPYGGGAGMVMKPEPLHEALESVLGPLEKRAPARVLFLSPQGTPLSHQKALELSREPRLVMICGRYEGMDERIRQLWVDEEISIGDYVVTGGELPALVVIDAVVRLLPGVLGNDQSAVNDSYADGIFDYPHYTRPEEFRGLNVPQVLLSGHHGQIERWRRKEALKRTLLNRPDLLHDAPLDKDDLRLLEKIRQEILDRAES